MNRRNDNRGFNLIELIVVAAIISLLATVILAALSNAREKARDSTRKAELGELQKAITHYFTTTGSYPSTGGVWLSSEVGSTQATNGADYSANWVPNILAANMITKLPSDPVGGINSSCSGTQYRSYLYRSDGTHYKLLSNCALEWDSYPTVGKKFYDPTRPTWALQLTDDGVATSGW